MMCFLQCNRKRVCLCVCCMHMDSFLLGGRCGRCVFSSYGGSIFLEIPHELCTANRNGPLDMQVVVVVCSDDHK